jgi:oxygen-independent coproporphyrinogen-3 oxidase
MNSLALPPLSLYIHIPWCERKCPYCDFNSHRPEAEIAAEPYIEALLRDLESDLHLVQGRPLASIFIGGGTPSLLPVAAIEHLLAAVRNTVALAPGCEVTLEANPGSAEADRFKGFVAAGVNRLSVGVQSFDDNRLAALGRVHDSHQAERAVLMALDSGAASINIDLMHGLPGQDSASACADLRRALDLGPSHLSWYQLTIERNTAFYKAPPELPEESLLGAIQDSGELLLAENGFEHYEVSAYARPGHRCRHNLNYWQFGDYLGIGAGAHGKITLPVEARVLRTAKRRQPAEYLAASPCFDAAGGAIEIADLRGDFMLNALRLKEGFDPALFTARTGLEIEQLEARCSRLAGDGLLEHSPSLVKPTSLGWRFLDDVVAAFL